MGYHYLYTRIGYESLIRLHLPLITCVMLVYRCRRILNPTCVGYRGDIVAEVLVDNEREEHERTCCYCWYLVHNDV